MSDFDIQALLKRFDKHFYPYDMHDEEYQLLEDNLLEEAKIANKNIKKNLEILRGINSEQLSLSKSNKEKEKHLAKKFIGIMEELRASHLMLQLIKIGVYELTLMRFDFLSSQDGSKTTFQ